jgi:hypothetical protein
MGLFKEIQKMIQKTRSIIIESNRRPKNIPIFAPDWAWNYGENKNTQK